MCGSSIQFKTSLPCCSLGDLSPARAGYSICLDLLLVPACPLLGPPATATNTTATTTAATTTTATTTATTTPTTTATATATAVPLRAAGSTAKELRGLYSGLEGAAIGPICCSSAAGTPVLGNQTPSAQSLPQPVGKTWQPGRAEGAGRGTPCCEGK